ncbi:MAG: DUF4388 domain-containing protein [Methylacidiphilales bacterium]|nr:DUF4388 domain-containing protein [Candidatus Methylacidiphilales bacterium]
MPIVGNLSEFPLPEVLLLIGSRTGRLRLLDVPEFGVLEIEISNGSVQTMRIGASAINETPQMLEKLGTIIQSQSGMFDFQIVPVSFSKNPQPLKIHDLAMQLVCHVDEQATRQSLAVLARKRHRLVDPLPDRWMDPDLDRFFCHAYPLLKEDVPMGELARSLEMDIRLVDENVNKLMLLGVVEAVEAKTTVIPMEPKEELNAESEQDTAQISQGIVEKSNAYFRVARMSDSIRKLSSRLPAI